MPLKKFSISLIIIVIALNVAGSLSQGYIYVPQKGSDDSFIQDTILENQILYNGRIWRNLYYMAEGNQFLFTDSYLTCIIHAEDKRLK